MTDLDVGETGSPALALRTSEGRRRRGTAALDALILDADLRQAMVCLRSLGGQGLYAGLAECDQPTAVPTFASRWSTVNAVLPDFRAGADEFVGAVLALLGAHPARVLLLGHDGTIATIRPWRSEIEGHGTVVALASEKALDIANDKQRTLELAAELGVPYPASIPLHDTSDVRRAMDEIGYPAVIKPASSWADNGKPLRLNSRDVLNQREAVEAVAQILDAGSTPIAQQWVGGRREAVSLFFAQGRVWAEFAQVAHRMYPVLGGSSVFRESIPVPADIGRASRALVETIGLEGYSEIEFRRDSAGRPLLMEINARLSASVEIAVRSGVDFPMLLWRWAAGEPLNHSTGYRTGVRMRWLNGDILWLRDNITRRGRPDSVAPARAMRTFAATFFQRSGYDWFDHSDLRPAIAAMRRRVKGSREKGAAA